MPVKDPSTSLPKVECCCNHRVSSSSDLPPSEPSSAVLAAGIYRRRSCCSALLTERRQKISATAARGRPCSCQTLFHSNLGSGSGFSMPVFVLPNLEAAILLNFCSCYRVT
nr:uncharacterized protein LOC114927635 isoform X2 [Arachis hypogaea]